MMRRRLAVLGLLLAMAGCGSSPPTHFHTLVPIPPTQRAAVRSPGGGPIQVGDVTIPPTLDRQAMVTMGPGTRVNVLGQDRWAGPLAGLIQRALVADLRARLGPDAVLAPGDPAPPKRLRVLLLTVQQFAGDQQGQVTLEGDWVIGRPQSPATAQTRHVSLRVAAGSTDADAVAMAMSQALGRLADQVAATL